MEVDAMRATMLLPATLAVATAAAVAGRALVEASVLDAAPEVGDLGKSWPNGGRENNEGSQATPYRGLASQGSLQAERTGFQEPRFRNPSQQMVYDCKAKRRLALRHIICAQELSRMIGRLVTV
jgi:hypothetical protein